MAMAMATLLRMVADQFGVSVADIKSTRRTRTVVPARHVAAHLAHTALGMTHQEIGRRLGGRDYTIIAMYCRAAVRRSDGDEEFRKYVAALSERLQT